MEDVKRLIPVSDPKARDSQALQWATQNGHAECIKLLIPVSDYSLVVSIMTQSLLNTTLLQQCIDDYEALQQKDRFNNQHAEMGEIKTKVIKRKL